MMIQEFEKLTGIFPTMDLYAAIEAAYTDFNGDKVAFCKVYKSNKDGIAERIARETSLAQLAAARHEAEALEMSASASSRTSRRSASRCRPSC